MCIDLVKIGPACLNARAQEGGFRTVAYSPFFFFSLLFFSYLVLYPLTPLFQPTAATATTATAPSSLTIPCPPFPLSCSRLSCSFIQCPCLSVCVSWHFSWCRTWVNKALLSPFPPCSLIHSHSHPNLSQSIPSDAFFFFRTPSAPTTTRKTNNKNWQTDIQQTEAINKTKTKQHKENQAIHITTNKGERRN